MRIELCIDIDASDLTMLLMIARQKNMPLDALIKKAIADFVIKEMTPSQEKRGEG